MFLEKFVDDKTPAMLLKELGSLEMEGKEKVKDFNKRFTCILNKFATTLNLMTPSLLITTRLHYQPTLCILSSEM